MIEIKQLTKCYGNLVALDHLDLTIASGTLFGFIGPNGAGKTTTLRMIAGVLEPTSGQIYLNGVDITKNVSQSKWSIGYMPDFFGVYEDMQVWEYLDFFARCYRLDATQRQHIVDELLELVDLGHKRMEWVQSLSRGMRQRLCLAQALVHDPQILLLDEPASGLDPRARIEIRELLKELSIMGKTIIISSHILTELDEMCHQVGIIEHGQLQYSGTPEGLINRHLERQLLFRTLANAEQVESALNMYSGVTGFHADGKGWHVKLQGDDIAMAGLLTHLIEHKLDIIHFMEKDRNLESIFMQVTKGDMARG
ncbi:MAG: hypothetical protein B6242_09520 [Anaerolineaceae bacterium 4572_78]|nr:MAG: hypothetical protein B6242_09520 [Anaerolineaceae bacterium 4572_78]